MPLDNTLFLKLLETRQAGMDRQVQLKQQELAQRSDIGNTVLDQLGKYQALKSKQLEDKRKVIEFQLANYGKAGVPADAVEWSKIPEEVRGIGEAAYLGGQEAHRHQMAGENFQINSMIVKNQNAQADRDLREKNYEAQNADRDAARAQRMHIAQMPSKSASQQPYGAKLPALDMGTSGMVKGYQKTAQHHQEGYSSLRAMLRQAGGIKDPQQRIEYYRAKLKDVNGALGGGGRDALQAPEVKRLMKLLSWGTVDWQANDWSDLVNIKPAGLADFEKILLEAANSAKTQRDTDWQAANDAQNSYFRQRGVPDEALPSVNFDPQEDEELEGMAARIDSEKQIEEEDEGGWLNWAGF